MTLMLGTNEKLIAKALLSLDTSSILLYQLACINLVDNDCLVITLKPVNSSCPGASKTSSIKGNLEAISVELSKKIMHLLEINIQYSL